MKVSRQLAIGVGGMCIALAAAAEDHAPQVLQVGTWHGMHGAYDSVQAAVDAARPGVTAPIASATSVAQLRSFRAAAAMTLTPADIEALDAAGAS